MINNNTQNLYLTKLHDELLVIMDEIDRVCKENNINYYLVGGSLLGAVRHKGFIPWDDDLDIAMPRQDWLRFIEIAPNSLNSNFSLDWITTNPKYWQFFAKVSEKNTLFEENSNMKTFQTGIFVDIFPLDLSPAYNKSLNRIRSFVKVLKSAISFKYCKVNTITELCIKMISIIATPLMLQNIILRTLMNVQKKGCTHYANFGSQYKLEKQTMPVEWYGDGTTLAFENRIYRVPVKYEQVLNSIYGKNFMEIPPLEKRRCHYPEKVVFRDGSTFYFGKSTHLVSIKEQEGL